MMLSPDHYTPDHIARRLEVWRRLHAVRHWPEPFEVADLDPLVTRIMGLVAIGDSLERKRAERDVSIRQFARAAATAAAHVPLHSSRPAFTGLDQKRRAAGERDDD